MFCVPKGDHADDCEFYEARGESRGSCCSCQKSLATRRLILADFNDPVLEVVLRAERGHVPRSSGDPLGGMQLGLDKDTPFTPFTWVWHPISWGNYLWSLMILVFILYTVLVAPFRLAFYWDHEFTAHLDPQQKFGVFRSLPQSWRGAT